mmetsp:Transcript_25134/g.53566  ORF Transcript_25134/g.53566 Transcript_25134/m.53566 type:complete len:87 (+) Transcript_25134:221-481(+)
MMEFGLLLTLVARNHLFAPGSILGENLYKLVDFILLLLEDAFRDPDQVTDFLLLQLNISIEAAKVELIFERQFQLLNIALVEGVID